MYKYTPKFAYKTPFIPSRNKLTCNNCGKVGHFINSCSRPPTSTGLIVYRRRPNNVLEYLMICRKNTYGYSEFIKGCYSTTCAPALMKLIDEMTNEEKDALVNTNDFSKLWANMWNLPYCNKTIEETTINKSHNKLCKKFDSIKKADFQNDGETMGNPRIVLTDLIAKSETTWFEPEWEFPKGRRTTGESDLECALREFEEETGIRSQFINVIENVNPYCESVMGSNMKPYINMYYVAEITTNSNSDNIDISKFQKSEVSQLKWLTFDACMQHIRSYNIEKQDILKNVNTMLLQYRPYTIL